ncbi:MAG: GNAT family N-acetyltransferase [Candidatus Micrarchaeota archaeon]|nr:GNAT family N-acetyltransferase [Candidatus Micrarchaeota archaeon]
MGFCIRKAQKVDVPAIIREWEWLQRESRAYSPALQLKPNFKTIYRKYLAKRLKARNALVLVATKKDRVVGHAVANLMGVFAVFVIDKEAYVEELFVERPYRRKGIGTKLLAAVQAWAKRKGVRQLSIMTNTENTRARGVYTNFRMKEFLVKLIKRV